MPPLENPRHEAFCNFIVKGYGKEDAYEEAGFTPGFDHANRLYQRNDILKRIAELRTEQTDISGATPRAVIAELLRLAKANEALEGGGALREARQCLTEALSLANALKTQRNAERKGWS
jgi:hypothetical protein